MPCTSCTGLYDWCVCAASRLSAGTDIGIAIRFITEVAAAEQRAIALVIDGAHDGNIRHHARRFAVSDLLSIGVTCVRHYVEAICFNCLFRRLRHGLRQRISEAIEHYSVRHDQRVFRIYGRLDVVCRKSLLTYQHKSSLRLRMLL